MKYNQWKKLSIPVMNDDFSKYPERYIKQFKKSGAQFVFLSLRRTFDSELIEKQLQSLKENIKLLSSEDFEVGFWTQSLGFGVPLTESEQKLADFTKIRGLDGNVAGDAFCPTDPRYTEYHRNIVIGAAKAGARYIMLDDDLCLNVRPGLGCTCEKHLELYEKKIGRPVTLEEIRGLVYKNNSCSEDRQKWLDCMGETLVDFCRTMRQAVDSVDPTIRMGFCAGYTSWDLEGIDAISLTKVLAGGTRPFLRLTGAPYWAEMRRFPGQTMHHIVEFTRMQQSWCEAEDIDFFTENDSYPRPRYRIPASYLETFDFCMTASGCSEQLKYMFDYCSNPEYEEGYLKAHLHNRNVIDKVEKITENLSDEGIYVYEPMRKTAKMRLPERTYEDHIMRACSFSYAAEMLSGLGISTTYHEHDGVTASFGASGQTVPTNKKGYILDIESALALQERGIDTGLLSAVPAKERATFEYFKNNNDRIQLDWLDTTWETLFFNAKIKDNAQIMSEFQCKKESYPASYYYVNDEGTPFLVFTFRADTMATGGSLFRSYYRQAQLIETIEAMGTKLPAVIKKEPGAYLICRSGDGQLAVAICNFSLDPIYTPHIKLAKEWKNAEFIGCNGTLKNNELELSDIHPYGFAAVLLK